ncbi:AAA family ATPase [Streptomyces shenzhenensis]|uniref:AAA family ATPase n=1 Tax=Streptomyces shenzhenensis TaxID=943815 RepID=UPI0035581756
MCLRGRRRARDTLSQVLDRGGEFRGGAVVLAGGVGAGKSALLQWACERAGARGWRVLRAGGGRGGVLGQLAGALPESGTAVPTGLVTSSTRGVQGIARPEELVLACERLRLALVRLARQLPLVVAVDDCEWLDAVSLRALTFVANRLAGTRVVLLAAVRAEDQGRLAGWEATRVEVEPLDEEAARLLLADHHPRLAPGVRSEVARVAEGCPLALIDLPRALTEAQRAGTAALPDPLPAGPGLDAAWGARFTALPPATRAAGGAGHGRRRAGARRLAVGRGPGGCESGGDGDGGGGAGHGRAGAAFLCGRRGPSGRPDRPRTSFVRSRTGAKGLGGPLSRLTDAPSIRSQHSHLRLRDGDRTPNPVTFPLPPVIRASKERNGYQTRPDRASGARCRRTAGRPVAQSGHEPPGSAPSSTGRSPARRKKPTRPRSAIPS